MQIQQYFKGEQQRADDPISDPGQILFCVFGQESPGIEADRQEVHAGFDSFPSQHSQIKHYQTSIQQVKLGINYHYLTFGWLDP